MRALVSSGSNQFHLSPLAAELSRQGHLAGLLTAGWPTPVAALVAAPFKRFPSVQRFFNRREEIPTDLLYPNNLAEIIFQIGIQLRRISEHTEQRFDQIAFKLYASGAGRVLRRVRPDVYHYRACYGLQSVKIARQMKIPTICDHSIAHPGVLQFMVDHEGRWPDAPERVHASPLQTLMQLDVLQADAVIVNSHFVRETCIFSGVPEDRLHVVYLGVDRKFFKSIPEFDFAQVQKRQNNSMIFVGGIQRRKGIMTLAKAIRGLPSPPKLRLIGGIEAGIERHVEGFLSHPHVSALGAAPRSELARHMTDAPVLIFPSYCEGSARVIFEAMACGCFIITTPNSGSIVRNHEHGLVVPAGDSDALAAAILWALKSPEEVARIGWSNAQLVRREFTQDRYGEKVLQVYRAVLQRMSDR
jgi:glycosyltransferase involved in cell wall biosynthesis